MIGLGRMGGNMVQRLLEAGHRVVAYDTNPDAVAAYQAMGAQAASSPCRTWWPAWPRPGPSG